MLTRLVRPCPNCGREYKSLWTEDVKMTELWWTEWNTAVERMFLAFARKNTLDKNNILRYSPPTTDNKEG